MTTQTSLSPALRAAILAAVAAYENEHETPVRDLTTSSDLWRFYGRRIQMAVRFDGRHVMPSLPIGHRGWERAPWRTMR